MVNMNIVQSIVESWAYEGATKHSFDELLGWIQELNKTVEVSITKNFLEDSSFWFYDKSEGCVRNQNNSFFQIFGIRQSLENKVIEQPIILQNEIGYLGILCKEFDGVLYFLMQAKIEPGNINKVQISPTIQATKSNFTQKHGGKQPAYLKYFLEANKHTVIVDQIQSEQSARFYQKRNRNIILKLDEDIDILPNYRWMTLKQIKQLMRINNLVNMDTRTVLSCIPFNVDRSDTELLASIEEKFRDKTLYRSIFIGNHENLFPQIFQVVNNYKMFKQSEVELIGLHQLKEWNYTSNGELVCVKEYPFKVVFCDIKIEGREVKQWTQPLFEANGIATFGLLITVDNYIKNFLIRVTPEIGCFDKVELGPTVQQEAGKHIYGNKISRLFWEKVRKKEGVLFDALLSEEGGRFYHEQNRNVLVETTLEEVGTLPEGYFWVDFKTLNQLVQINNILNIQLRNLLSLLEV